MANFGIILLAIITIITASEIRTEDLKQIKPLKFSDIYEDEIIGNEGILGIYTLKLGFHLRNNLINIFGYLINGPNAVNDDLHHYLSEIETGIRLGTVDVFSLIPVVASSSKTDIISQLKSILIKLSSDESTESKITCSAKEIVPKIDKYKRSVGHVNQKMLMNGLLDPKNGMNEEKLQLVSRKIVNVLNKQENDKDNDEVRKVFGSPIIPEVFKEVKMKMVGLNQEFFGYLLPFYGWTVDDVHLQYVVMELAYALTSKKRSDVYSCRVGGFDLNSYLDDPIRLLEEFLKLLIESVCFDTNYAVHTLIEELTKHKPLRYLDYKKSFKGIFIHLNSLPDLLYVIEHSSYPTEIVLARDRVVDYLKKVLPYIDTKSFVPYIYKTNEEMLYAFLNYILKKTPFVNQKIQASINAIKAHLILIIHPQKLSSELLLVLIDAWLAPDLNDEIQERALRIKRDVVDDFVKIDGILNKGSNKICYNIYDCYNEAVLVFNFDDEKWMIPKCIKYRFFMNQFERFFENDYQKLFDSITYQVASKEGILSILSLKEQNEVLNNLELYKFCTPFETLRRILETIRDKIPSLSTSMSEDIDSILPILKIKTQHLGRLSSAIFDVIRSTFRSRHVDSALREEQKTIDAVVQGRLPEIDDALWHLHGKFCVKILDCYNQMIEQINRDAGFQTPLKTFKPQSPDLYSLNIDIEGDMNVDVLLKIVQEMQNNRNLNNNLLTSSKLYVKEFEDVLNDEIKSVQCEGETVLTCFEMVLDTLLFSTTLPVGVKVNIIQYLLKPVVCDRQTCEWIAYEEEGSVLINPLLSYIQHLLEKFSKEIESVHLQLDVSEIIEALTREDVSYALSNYQLREKDDDETKIMIFLELLLNMYYLPDNTLDCVEHVYLYLSEGSYPNRLTISNLAGIIALLSSKTDEIAVLNEMRLTLNKLEGNPETFDVLKNVVTIDCFTMEKCLTTLKKEIEKKENKKHHVVMRSLKNLISPSSCTLNVCPWLKELPPPLVPKNIQRAFIESAELIVQYEDVPLIIQLYLKALLQHDMLFEILGNLDPTLVSFDSIYALRNELKRKKRSISNDFERDNDFKINIFDKNRDFERFNKLFRFKREVLNDGEIIINLNLNEEKNCWVNHTKDLNEYVRIKRNVSEFDYITLLREKRDVKNMDYDNKNIQQKGFEDENENEESGDYENNNYKSENYENENDLNGDYDEYDNNNDEYGNDKNQYEYYKNDVYDGGLNYYNPSNEESYDDEDSENNEIDENNEEYDLNDLNNLEEGDYSDDYNYKDSHYEENYDDYKENYDYKDDYKENYDYKDDYKEDYNKNKTQLTTNLNNIDKLRDEVEPALIEWYKLLEVEDVPADLNTYTNYIISYLLNETIPINLNSKTLIDLLNVLLFDLIDQNYRTKINTLQFTIGQESKNVNNKLKSMRVMCYYLDQCLRSLHENVYNNFLEDDSVFGLIINVLEGDDCSRIDCPHKIDVSSLEKKKFLKIMQDKYSVLSKRTKTFFHIALDLEIISDFFRSTQSENVFPDKLVYFKDRNDIHVKALQILIQSQNEHVPFEIKMSTQNLLEYYLDKESPKYLHSLNLIQIGAILKTKTSEIRIQRYLSRIIKEIERKQNVLSQNLLMHSLECVSFEVCINNLEDEMLKVPQKKYSELIMKLLYPPMCTVQKCFWLDCLKSTKINGIIKKIDDEFDRLLKLDKTLPLCIRLDLEVIRDFISLKQIRIYLNRFEPDPTQNIIVSFMLSVPEEVLLSQGVYQSTLNFKYFIDSLRKHLPKTITPKAVDKLVDHLLEATNDETAKSDISELRTSLSQINIHETINNLENVNCVNIPKCGESLFMELKSNLNENDGETTLLDVIFPPSCVKAKCIWYPLIDYIPISLIIQSQNYLDELIKQPNVPVIVILKVKHIVSKLRIERIKEVAHLITTHNLINSTDSKSVIKQLLDEVAKLNETDPETKEMYKEVGGYLENDVNIPKIFLSDDVISLLDYIYVLKKNSKKIVADIIRQIHIIRTYKKQIDVILKKCSIRCIKLGACCKEVVKCGKKIKDPYSHYLISLFESVNDNDLLNPDVETSPEVFLPINEMIFFFKREKGFDYVHLDLNDEETLKIITNYNFNPNAKHLFYFESGNDNIMMDLEDEKFRDIIKNYDTNKRIVDVSYVTTLIIFIPTKFQRMEALKFDFNKEDTWIILRDLSKRSIEHPEKPLVEFRDINKKSYKLYIDLNAYEDVFEILKASIDVVSPKDYIYVLPFPSVVGAPWYSVIFGEKSFLIWKVLNEFSTKECLNKPTPVATKPGGFLKISFTVSSEGNIKSLMGIKRTYPLIDPYVNETRHVFYCENLVTGKITVLEFDLRDQIALQLIKRMSNAWEKNRNITDNRATVYVKNQRGKYIYLYLNFDDMDPQLIKHIAQDKIKVEEYNDYKNVSYIIVAPKSPGSKFFTILLPEIKEVSNELKKIGENPNLKGPYSIINVPIEPAQPLFINFNDPLTKRLLWAEASKPFLQPISPTSLTTPDNKTIIAMIIPNRGDPKNPMQPILFDDKPSIYKKIKHLNEPNNTNAVTIPFKSGEPLKINIFNPKVAKILTKLPEPDLNPDKVIITDFNKITPIDSFRSFYGVQSLSTIPIYEDETKKLLYIRGTDQKVFDKIVNICQGTHKNSATIFITRPDRERDEIYCKLDNPHVIQALKDVSSKIEILPDPGTVFLVVLTDEIGQLKHHLIHIGPKDMMKNMEKITMNVREDSATKNAIYYSDLNREAKTFLMDYDYYNGYIEDDYAPSLIEMVDKTSSDLAPTKLINPKGGLPLICFYIMTSPDDFINIPEPPKEIINEKKPTIHPDDLWNSFTTPSFLESTKEYDYYLINEDYNKKEIEDYFDFDQYNYEYNYQDDQKKEFDDNYFIVSTVDPEEHLKFFTTPKVYEKNNEEVATQSFQFNTDGELFTTSIPTESTTHYVYYFEHIDDYNVPNESYYDYVNKNEDFEESGDYNVPNESYNNYINQNEDFEESGDYIESYYDDKNEDFEESGDYNDNYYDYGDSDDYNVPNEDDDYEENGDYEDYNKNYDYDLEKNKEGITENRENTKNANEPETLYIEYGGEYAYNEEKKYSHVYTKSEKTNYEDDYYEGSDYYEGESYYFEENTIYNKSYHYETTYQDYDYYEGDYYEGDYYDDDYYEDDYYEDEESYEHDLNHNNYLHGTHEFEDDYEEDDYEEESYEHEEYHNNFLHGIHESEYHYEEDYEDEHQEDDYYEEDDFEHDLHHGNGLHGIHQLGNDHHYKRKMKQIEDEDEESGDESYNDEKESYNDEEESGDESYNDEEESGDESYNNEEESGDEENYDEDEESGGQQIDEEESGEEENDEEQSGEEEELEEEQSGEEESGDEINLEYEESGEQRNDDDAESGNDDIEELGVEHFVDDEESDEENKEDDEQSGEDQISNDIESGEEQNVDVEETDGDGESGEEEGNVNEEDQSGHMERNVQDEESGEERTAEGDESVEEERGDDEGSGEEKSIEDETEQNGENKESGEERNDNKGSGEEKSIEDETEQNGENKESGEERNDNEGSGEERNDNEGSGEERNDNESSGEEENNKENGNEERGDDESSPENEEDSSGEERSAEETTTTTEGLTTIKEVENESVRSDDSATESATSKDEVTNPGETTISPTTVPARRKRQISSENLQIKPRRKRAILKRKLVKRVKRGLDSGDLKKVNIKSLKITKRSITTQNNDELTQKKEELTKTTVCIDQEDPQSRNTILSLNDPNNLDAIKIILNSRTGENTIVFLKKDDPKTKRELIQLTKKIPSSRVPATNLGNLVTLNLKDSENTLYRVTLDTLRPETVKVLKEITYSAPKTAPKAIFNGPAYENYIVSIDGDNDQVVHTVLTTAINSEIIVGDVNSGYGVLIYPPHIINMNNPGVREELLKLPDVKSENCGVVTVTIPDKNGVKRVKKIDMDDLRTLNIVEQLNVFTPTNLEVLEIPSGKFGYPYLIVSVDDEQGRSRCVILDTNNEKIVDALIQLAGYSNHHSSFLNLHDSHGNKKKLYLDFSDNLVKNRLQELGLKSQLPQTLLANIPSKYPKQLLIPINKMNSQTLIVKCDVTKWSVVNELLRIPGKCTRRTPGTAFHILSPLTNKPITIYYDLQFSVTIKRLKQICGALLIQPDPNSLIIIQIKPEGESKLIALDPNHGPVIGLINRLHQIIDIKSKVHLMHLIGDDEINGGFKFNLNDPLAMQTIIKELQSGFLIYMSPPIQKNNLLILTIEIEDGLYGQLILDISDNNVIETLQRLDDPENPDAILVDFIVDGKFVVVHLDLTDIRIIETIAVITAKELPKNPSPQIEPSKPKNYQDDKYTKNPEEIEQDRNMIELNETPDENISNTWFDPIDKDEDQLIICFVDILGHTVMLHFNLNEPEVVETLFEEAAKSDVFHSRVKIILKNSSGELKEIYLSTNDEKSLNRLKDIAFRVEYIPDPGSLIHMQLTDEKVGIREIVILDLMNKEVVDELLEISAKTKLQESTHLFTINKRDFVKLIKLNMKDEEQLLTVKKLKLKTPSFIRPVEVPNPFGNVPFISFTILDPYKDNLQIILDMGNNEVINTLNKLHNTSATFPLEIKFINVRREKEIFILDISQSEVTKALNKLSSTIQLPRDAMKNFPVLNAGLLTTLTLPIESDNGRTDTYIFDVSQPEVFNNLLERSKKTPKIKLGVLLYIPDELKVTVVIRFDLEDKANPGSKIVATQLDHKSIIAFMVKTYEDLTEIIVLDRSVKIVYDTLITLSKEKIPPPYSFFNLHHFDGYPIEIRINLQNDSTVEKLRSLQEYTSKPFKPIKISSTLGNKPVTILTIPTQNNPFQPIIINSNDEEFMGDLRNLLDEVIETNILNPVEIIIENLDIVLTNRKVLNYLETISENCPVQQTPLMQIPDYLYLTVMDVEFHLLKLQLDFMDHIVLDGLIKISKETQTNTMVAQANVLDTRTKTVFLFKYQPANQRIVHQLITLSIRNVYPSRISIRPPNGHLEYYIYSIPWRLAPKNLNATLNPNDGNVIYSALEASKTVSASSIPKLHFRNINRQKIRINMNMNCLEPLSALSQIKIDPIIVIPAYGRAPLLSIMVQRDINQYAITINPNDEQTLRELERVGSNDNTNATTITFFIRKREKIHVYLDFNDDKVLESLQILTKRSPIKIVPFRHRYPVIKAITPDNVALILDTHNKHVINKLVKLSKFFDDSLTEIELRDKRGVVMPVWIPLIPGVMIPNVEEEDEKGDFQPWLQPSSINLDEFDEYGSGYDDDYDKNDFDYYDNYKEGLDDVEILEEYDFDDDYEDVYEENDYENDDNKVYMNFDDNDNPLYDVNDYSFIKQNRRGLNGDDFVPPELEETFYGDLTQKSVTQEVQELTEPPRTKVSSNLSNLYYSDNNQINNNYPQYPYYQQYNQYPYYQQYNQYPYYQQYNQYPQYPFYQQYNQYPYYQQYNQYPYSQNPVYNLYNSYYTYPNYQNYPNYDNKEPEMYVSSDSISNDILKYIKDKYKASGDYEFNIFDDENKEESGNDYFEDEYDNYEDDYEEYDIVSFDYDEDEESEIDDYDDDDYKEDVYDDDYYKDDLKNEVDNNYYEDDDDYYEDDLKNEVDNNYYEDNDDYYEDDDDYYEDDDDYYEDDDDYDEDDDDDWFMIGDYSNLLKKREISDSDTSIYDDFDDNYESIDEENDYYEALARDGEDEEEDYDYESSAIDDEEEEDDDYESSAIDDEEEDDDYESSAIDNEEDDDYESSAIEDEEENDDDDESGEEIESGFELDEEIESEEDVESGFESGESEEIDDDEEWSGKKRDADEEEIESGFDLEEDIENEAESGEDVESGFESEEIIESGFEEFDSGEDNEIDIIEEESSGKERSNEEDEEESGDENKERTDHEGSSDEERSNNEDEEESGDVSNENKERSDDEESSGKKRSSEEDEEESGDVSNENKERSDDEESSGKRRSSEEDEEESGDVSNENKERTDNEESSGKERSNEEDGEESEDISNENKERTDNEESSGEERSNENETTDNVERSDESTESNRSIEEEKEVSERNIEESTTIKDDESSSSNENDSSSERSILETTLENSSPPPTTTSPPETKRRRRSRRVKRDLNQDYEAEFEEMARKQRDIALVQTELHDLKMFYQISEVFVNFQLNQPVYRCPIRVLPPHGQYPLVFTHIKYTNLPSKNRIPPLTIDINNIETLKTLRNISDNVDLSLPYSLIEIPDTDGNILGFRVDFNNVQELGGLIEQSNKDILGFEPQGNGFPVVIIKYPEGDVRLDLKDDKIVEMLRNLSSDSINAYWLQINHGTEFEIFRIDLKRDAQKIKHNSELNLKLPPVTRPPPLPPGIVTVFKTQTPPMEVITESIPYETEYYQSIDEHHLEEHYQEYNTYVYEIDDEDGEFFDEDEDYKKISLEYTYKEDIQYNYNYHYETIYYQYDEYGQLHKIDPSSQEFKVIEPEHGHKVFVPSYYYYDQEENNFNLYQGQYYSEEEYSQEYGDNEYLGNQNKDLEKSPGESIQPQIDESGGDYAGYDYPEINNPNNNMSSITMTEESDDDYLDNNPEDGKSSAVYDYNENPQKVSIGVPESLESQSKVLSEILTRPKQPGSNEYDPGESIQPQIDYPDAEYDYLEYPIDPEINNPNNNMGSITTAEESDDDYLDNNPEDGKSSAVYDHNEDPQKVSIGVPESLESQSKVLSEILTRPKQPGSNEYDPGESIQPQINYPDAGYDYPEINNPNNNMGSITMTEESDDYLDNNEDSYQQDLNNYSDDENINPNESIDPEINYPNGIINNGDESDDDYLNNNENGYPQDLNNYSDGGNIDADDENINPEDPMNPQIDYPDDNVGVINNGDESDDDYLNNNEDGYPQDLNNYSDGGNIDADDENINPEDPINPQINYPDDNVGVISNGDESDDDYLNNNEDGYPQDLNNYSDGGNIDSDDENINPEDPINSQINYPNGIINNGDESDDDYLNNNEDGYPQDLNNYSDGGNIDADDENINPEDPINPQINYPNGIINNGDESDDDYLNNNEDGYPQDLNNYSDGGNIDSDESIDPQSNYPDDNTSIINNGDEFDDDYLNNNEHAYPQDLNNYPDNENINVDDQIDPQINYPDDNMNSISMTEESDYDYLNNIKDDYPQGLNNYPDAENINPDESIDLQSNYPDDNTSISDDYHNNNNPGDENINPEDLSDPEMNYVNTINENNKNDYPQENNDYNNDQNQQQTLSGSPESHQSHSNILSKAVTKPDELINQEDNNEIDPEYKEQYLDPIPTEDYDKTFNENDDYSPTKNYPEYNQLSSDQISQNQKPGINEDYLYDAQSLNVAPSPWKSKTKMDIRKPDGGDGDKYLESVEVNEKEYDDDLNGDEYDDDLHEEDANENDLDYESYDNKDERDGDYFIQQDERTQSHEYETYDKPQLQHPPVEMVTGPTFEYRSVVPQIPEDNPRPENTYNPFYSSFEYKGADEVKYNITIDTNNQELMIMLKAFSEESTESLDTTSPAISIANLVLEQGMEIPLSFNTWDPRTLDVLIDATVKSTGRYPNSDKVVAVKTMFHFSFTDKYGRRHSYSIDTSNKDVIFKLKELEKRSKNGPNANNLFVVSIPLPSGDFYSLGLDLNNPITAMNMEKLSEESSTGQKIYLIDDVKTEISRSNSYY
ncbi:uncharacterized protein [Onthophagus taurus]|uniref:uncharacterized protein n=1 Tax=Onthophagus taurus TaxID=166361 RepID=UPI0039BDB6C9